jgi:rfaE bifunctional protein kinase chain/domain
MKKNSKKSIVVLVTGRFNVLHPGHIRLLRYAKEVGTKLIVGVEGDKLIGNDSHVSEQLRLDGVKNLKMVNDAFIFNDKIEQVLINTKPDIVVKGKEHENNKNIEEKTLNEMGAKLLFSSGELFFSLSDFFDTESQGFNFRRPSKYLDRHLIKNSKLTSVLDKFNDLKICVIGDTIVDEYIMCEPLGMSQEDPTIVVTPLENKMYLGGAGIVASHAVGIGAMVDFVSVIGKDQAGLFATKSLEKYNVKSHLIIDESRPTTLKQRFRCNDKTMLRVSHLQQTAISKNIQDKIFSYLSKKISSYDLLVFSDFNYGCLPQELVNKIIDLALKNKVFLSADSQSSSQFGDITRFKNMDLITPTEREARLAARDINSGLVVLCDQLFEISKSKNIILKLGENGVLIQKNIRKEGQIFTDEIISLNKSPKDTAGAGDSLLICSAMALSVGADIWTSSYLGSLAAAIQISRIGNIPLQINELMLAIKK